MMNRIPVMMMMMLTMLNDRPRFTNSINNNNRKLKFILSGLKLQIFDRLPMTPPGCCKLLYDCRDLIDCCRLFVIDASLC